MDPWGIENREKYPLRVPAGETADPAQGVSVDSAIGHSLTRPCALSAHLPYEQKGLLAHLAGGSRPAREASLLRPLHIPPHKTNPRGSKYPNVMVSGPKTEW